jgi:uncharacterized protein YggT (Ycf19 family)
MVRLLLLLQIYLAILTVRVLLSWFRNIDWFSEPWNTLRQVGSGHWSFLYMFIFVR